VNHAVKGYAIVRITTLRELGVIHARKITTSILNARIVNVTVQEARA